MITKWKDFELQTFSVLEILQSSLSCWNRLILPFHLSIFSIDSTIADLKVGHVCILYKFKLIYLFILEGLSNERPCEHTISVILIQSRFCIEFLLIGEFNNKFGAYKLALVSIKWALYIALQWFIIIILLWHWAHAPSTIMTILCMMLLMYINWFRHQLPSCWHQQQCVTTQLSCTLISANQLLTPSNYKINYNVSH